MRIAVSVRAWSVRRSQASWPSSATRLLSELEIRRPRSPGPSPTTIGNPPFSVWLEAHSGSGSRRLLRRPARQS